LWTISTGPKGTFLDKDEQFDYLLVSIALYWKNNNIGIERRGILITDKWEPFDTVNQQIQPTLQTMLWFGQILILTGAIE